MLSSQPRLRRFERSVQLSCPSHASACVLGCVGVREGVIAERRHTPMSECLDLALLHLTSHMHSASLARAPVLRTPRLRAYYRPPTMINGGSPCPVHAIPHAQSSLLNQQFVTHPLTQVACATPPNRTLTRSPLQVSNMAPSCRSILLGASMAAALVTGG